MPNLRERLGPLSLPGFDILPQEVRRKDRVMRPIKREVPANFPTKYDISLEPITVERRRWYYLWSKKLHEKFNISANKVLPEYNNMRKWFLQYLIPDKTKNLYRTVEEITGEPKGRKNGHVNRIYRDGLRRLYNWSHQREEDIPDAVEKLGLDRFFYERVIIDFRLKTVTQLKRLSPKDFEELATSEGGFQIIVRAIHRYDPLWAPPKIDWKKKYLLPNILFSKKK